MSNYKIELTPEEKKVFSILSTVSDPYKIFSELECIKDIDFSQEGIDFTRQYSWDTPLDLVIKKED